MDAGERESLMEQLRVMAAGRGDGIDLESSELWVIAGLKDSTSFFRHLGRLIPGGSILYFEGCGILPEVARFYEANRASNAVSVTRDTIFPIPETFHVSMTPSVLESLIGFLGQHPVEACLDHVKAYVDEKLLLAFHDAFDGSDFLVSGQVPEDMVQGFCSAVGVTYRREHNFNKRDPEQLRRVLWALENPNQLRMNWPWWKKALLFWKR
jgi:hypothetical protein